MTLPTPDPTPDPTPVPSAATVPHERPYQSLYRRYRPQLFGEVRGQDHVTRALRNAVREDRIAHAYLFSGPRGTGKTSTARILAKALNCASLADGDPCGTCESCVSIVAGSSFDVHELDAASNNGVDAMRDLVARAALATPGRWKVYIVDEVHMLSTAASNALLKTLEEPPEHVVFVLATTDPQKVLATIRSRTQHFEFHLLGEDVLEALLADVASDAGLDLPVGGIGVALRRGRGSARDALSMLDQVAASGATEDDTDQLAAVIRGVSDRDTALVLTALDAALHSGRDPQQIAVELVERLRSGFLALVAPGVAPAAPPLDEARALGTARCVRTMELVGGAIVAMRDAPEPRITLEVALARCAHPEVDDSAESMLDRLQQLERRIELLEAGGGHTATPAPHVPPRGDTRRARVPASLEAPVPPGAGVATNEVASGAEDATTKAASKPSLGAYRRPTAAAAAAGDPAAGASTPAVAMGAERVASAANSGPSPTPVRAGPIAPPAGSAPAGSAPAGSAPAGSAPAGSAPAPEPGVTDTPDRDALVAAWGDHVITSLRPKVRAYFQAGRFIGTDRADAVFALPNAVHVAQAESMKSEVVDALSRHFGRPVGLRLVAEGTPTPPAGTLAPLDEPRAAGSAPPARGAEVAPRGAGATGAARELVAAPATVRPRPAQGRERGHPEPAGGAAVDAEIALEIDGVADLVRSDDLATSVPDTGLSWAEDRLLEAFPGAEEV